MTKWTQYQDKNDNKKNVFLTLHIEAVSWK